MNVYVFGNFCDGYSQYPNDLTSEILKKLYPKAKSTTQVAIHRDGNLMYYCYIRKLDNGRYIGFCIAITGCYITSIKSIFGKFEQVIEIAAKRGSLIHYGERGNLTTSLQKLSNASEEVAFVINQLYSLFEPLVNSATKLPPTDFSVSHNSLINFSESDDKYEIIRSSYTYSYTLIYKEKDYNTVQMNSYQGVLFRVSKERDDLKLKNSNLTSQLAKAKVRQRNLVWVSVLGAIAIILGIIVWNKVLFPSEVTNYKTQDYTYYGPMKNGKPNGIGVAIYPDDDKYERRYYVGRFENGTEQDSSSFVLYTDGDFFYGKTEGNKRVGVFFSKRDKFHVEGTLVDDETYAGIEFNHVLGTTYNHKQTKIFRNGK